MWFQQQHNESNIYRPFEGNEPQSADAILGEIWTMYVSTAANLAGCQIFSDSNSQR